MAQIVDFGSLVLDRTLDQTFLAGAIVHAITPQDVNGVNGQSRQLTIDNQGSSNQNGDRSRIFPPIYQ